MLAVNLLQFKINKVVQSRGSLKLDNKVNKMTCYVRL